MPHSEIAIQNTNNPALIVLKLEIDDYYTDSEILDMLGFVTCQTEVGQMVKALIKGNSREHGHPKLWELQMWADSCPAITDITIEEIPKADRQWDNPINWTDPTGWKDD